MKILLNIMTGLAVLIGSFWLTLQIIDHTPDRAPSDVEIAMQKEGVPITGAISDEGSIIGYIDRVERDGTGRVILGGWAYDKETSRPVVVGILLGSQFERVAVTQGARDDVTAALRLSLEKTKDVAFNGRTERPLECAPFEVIVLAYNQNKHASILNPNLQVPRCPR